MATKYAEVTYPNAGGDTEFTIPFEYLEQGHLTVTLDGVTQTNGTDFTINETTSKVVFDSATPAGDEVIISRKTPIATNKLTVTFADGSGLSADDLNESAKQNIFAVQELTDFHNEDIEGVNQDALFKINNLSDLPSTSTARTNLDVYSKTESDGLASDKLVNTNNLSDVDNAGTSRTNLGLGTIATQDSSAVTITGGSVSGITDLAIADGGTGASDKTSAFDSLAPTTTKGDLIVTNGTNNTRLALGTDGMALVADSSKTAGLKWADTTNAAPYALLGKSSNQSIATGVTTTVIWDSETSDTGGWNNTSTGIITPDKEGLYYIGGFVRMAGMPDKALVDFSLLKGSTVIHTTTINCNTGLNGMHISGIIELNGSTDTIKATLIQTTGSSKDIQATYCQLNVVYLGT